MDVTFGTGGGISGLSLLQSSDSEEDVFSLSEGEEGFSDVMASLEGGESKSTAVLLEEPKKEVEAQSQGLDIEEEISIEEESVLIPVGLPLFQPLDYSKIRQEGGETLDQPHILSQDVPFQDLKPKLEQEFSGERFVKETPQVEVLQAETLQVEVSLPQENIEIQREIKRESPGELKTPLSDESVRSLLTPQPVAEPVVEEVIRLAAVMENKNSNPTMSSVGLTIPLDKGERLEGVRASQQDASGDEGGDKETSRDSESFEGSLSSSDVFFEAISLDGGKKMIQKSSLEVSPRPEIILPSSSAPGQAPETASLEFESVTPQQVANQVARQIIIPEKMEVGSPEKITIRLHPDDLGSVEVSLEFAPDGVLKVTMVADPKALALLKEGADALASSLNEKGFSADAQSFSFEQSSGQSFSERRQGSLPGVHLGELLDHPELVTDLHPHTITGQSLGRRASIDLHI